MKYFVIWLALTVLGQSGVHAQASDRNELLRTVLRAVVREGYPWKSPERSIVALTLDSACVSAECRRGAPSDTLPRVIQEFIADSLQTPILGSPEQFCTIGKDAELVIVSEPSIQGDTAFVKVRWTGCCQDPVLKRCHPAEALIELARNQGIWTIKRLASQTIT